MNREYLIIYADDSTKTYNGLIKVEPNGELTLFFDDDTDVDILVHCYAPGEWKEVKLKNSVLLAE